MSDDQLKSIHQFAANERMATFERTAQANARAQRRAYRIRWTCRCLITVLGVLGITLLAFGGSNYHVGGAGMLCLLATFPPTVVLFFMGGFVPSYKMRRFLSDREKRLLDD